jgi:hypothetical protein
LDVSELLSDAWQAVEASKVPPQIQEAAFVQAVQLLSGSSPTGQRSDTGGEGAGKRGRSTKSPKAAKSASSSTRSSSNQNDAAEDVPDEDEFFENLVEHTNVDREILEDLFGYSPTKITLNVTGRQLGTTLKKKQVAAGILLSVAYQYGLGHPTTSVGIIREECTRLRGVDNNLPTYLRETKGIRLVGDGRVKDIQLRDAALDLFKSEAERITGKSEAAE